MGSIVRVPLSGRRTRGFVVEIDAGRAGELKEIASVSGAAPVFGPGLLEGLRWAAIHYVAPVPVLLERCAPPNLPRSTGHAPRDGLPTTGDLHGPLAKTVRRALAGGRTPATAVVAKWQSPTWINDLVPLLASGRSILVVVPTATEVSEIIDHARPVLKDRVVEVSGDRAGELTESWEETQTPGKLVVGTPRVSSWQVAGLSLAVVVEEGRRAMKDRQTPTIHTRDLLAVRARIEGFGLVFLGPTPTLEVLAGGAGVERWGGRPWGLVEVIDRTEDPPGSGFLSDRVIAAIRTLKPAGRRGFVFTHRRAADSSMRCRDCRRVRACESCGSRLGRSPTCRRCGADGGPCPGCGGSSFEEMGSIPERLVAEINRKIGAGTAGSHPAGTPVSVGTERDLAGLGGVDLAVAVDADALLLGYNYRTSEEALRVLARLGDSLRAGSGRRMMVQTSMPQSELFSALRTGDPIPYLEHLLAERARLGLPPSSEMLALEIRGSDIPPSIGDQLRGLEGVTVLGPAIIDTGKRWLLQGDLGGARRDLRAIAQKGRDAGLTVRIDADPIDL